MQLITHNSFGKLPVAIQAIIGFALVAIGAITMINAEGSSGGDTRFLLLFLLVGVLYLASGLPSMLEGFMTMFYKKEE